MKSTIELKNLVREKYGQIARQEKEVNKSSCCGASCCSDEVYNIMTEEYTSLDGYNEDADLGLGCGLPTEFAQIKEGDTVLDLGSGAGNDCFVARHETGESGQVIGVDFTTDMIDQARKNTVKLGYENVEFRYGDIEDIPVKSSSVDVVVSNCVLNLLPDKTKIFGEIHRVLNAGGHFSISDIVLQGQLPDGLRNDAEMYAGCVSGAIQKDDYLDLISNAGFQDIQVQKEGVIDIPHDILTKYLSEEEIRIFNSGDLSILSVTVFGRK